MDGQYHGSRSACTAAHTCIYDNPYFQFQSRLPFEITPLGVCVRQSTRSASKLSQPTALGNSAHLGFHGLEPAASIHSGLRPGTLGHGLLLIYRLRKDERLSRPGWLAYSEQFTERGQEKSAGQDRRFTHCSTQPTSY